MRTFRFWAAVMIVPMVISLAGCEGVRRKFSRKRNKAKETEPIFALQKEYRPEFSPEVRYQAHFAYWKAAHDDLLECLQGSTRRRREYAVAQSIKELESMQDMLEGSPVSGLEEVIAQMEKARAKLTAPGFEASSNSILRSQLETLRRRIDRQYDYHKVKQHLKPDMSASSGNDAPAH